MRKFTTKLPKTIFFLFFWNFFTLSQTFYTHGVRSVRDKYQVWPTVGRKVGQSLIWCEEKSQEWRWWAKRVKFGGRCSTKPGQVAEEKRKCNSRLRRSCDSESKEN